MKSRRFERLPEDGLYDLLKVKPFNCMLRFLDDVQKS